MSAVSSFRRYAKFAGIDASKINWISVAQAARADAGARRANGVTGQTIRARR